MKMNVEIRDFSYLYRTIESTILEIEKLTAGVFLIVFEFRSASKVQLNLVSSEGSLHYEYKNNIITYYFRGDFSFAEICNMSVSVIQPFGSAYTSRLIGKNSFDCIEEYLRMSDQRNGVIQFNNDSVIKIEKLPPTKYKEKNMFLESILIKTYDVSEQEVL